MFRPILIAGLALALSACGALGTSTPQQQIAAGCVTSSAALKALTVANDAGKLAPEQQKQILTAVGVITPICSAEDTPTLDDVKLAAFTQAIAALQTAVLKVKEPTP